MDHEDLEEGSTSVVELERQRVEMAMDEYDELGPDGFSAKYPQFGHPKDYWVRPSRPRGHKRYPTKPIVAVARGVHTLNGGWGSRESAASLLHNTGYIIVGSDGVPTAAPQDRDYLLTGARWIRACAMTNYIAPARARGDSEVRIVAGDLHNEMGLARSWANVCQVLGGQRFLKYAVLPEPDVRGPAKSTTTTFIYDLRQRTMPDSQPDVSTTNLILYGPPGTGKTYETAVEAVRLCLGEVATQELVRQGRTQLIAAYRELEAAGRIEFVTFHQSYAYEEFVEGLRPTTDVESDAPEQAEGGDTPARSGGFRLQTHDGIFKRLCERARLDTGSDQNGKHLDRHRPVFKMALGRRGIGEDRIAEGLNEGLIHIGWGGDIDWSDSRFDDFDEIRKQWQAQKDPDASGKDPNVEMMYSFRSAMQIDDYVVLSDGRDTIRAIGQVTGEYYFDRAAAYHPHRRKVRWFWQNDQGAERGAFYPKYFRRQTVYRLRSELINWDELEKIALGEEALQPAATARPYVLVIDEINRANISKVFGELITLLEPDKRLGKANEIRIKLPYSGNLFGVPANLHIIGTMNTADRSIALLDTALRRRFDFRELMPRPDLLETVGGIDLRAVLRTINERIEYLFDREHQVGHAYFIGCKSREAVERVMRHKIIPLLAEYFYEDWGKVAVVLGDANDQDNDREGMFLDRKRLSAPKGMGSDSEGTARYRWSVRENFDFSGLVQG